jgi:release factor glutamine methyltransferase
VTAASASVGEALGAAVDALGAAGVDDPRLDAELLLAGASGLDRATLTAEPDQPLSGGASRAFGLMVRRRLRREPVAYILGRKGFRRIDVEVDRRVLIPRPETELLVEVALQLRPRRVLDVGTGSGAVALAVADELPATELVATDTSTEALAVARINATRVGVADRVRFAPGTLPEAERFDLVLANLPYVSEPEWEQLPPEIREYEPRTALVSGPTGLEAIESLLDGLAAPADVTGGVAVEVGAGQAEAVAELIADAGFDSTEVLRDLAGIERVVSGARVAEGGGP